MNYVYDKDIIYNKVMHEPSPLIIEPINVPINLNFINEKPTINKTRPIDNDVKKRKRHIEYDD